MGQNYLSDIELYFSEKVDHETKNILIDGDEFKHIQKVMRHDVGDFIHVTDGLGCIYKCEITDLLKKELSSKIVEEIKYQNNFDYIAICLPRLKSADRFEFAIEKCVELGITNFLVYQADRSVAKGEKIDRWEKIAVAAMKQSLRSYKPKFEFIKSLKAINQLNNVIVFDQNAETKLKDFVLTLNQDAKYTFLFGPEGGYSDNELEILSVCKKIKLTENRLRAETAVITAASVICV